jgi:hypothetical protein
MIAIFLSATAGLPGLAWGQPASPSDAGQIQTEIQRRRVIVHPQSALDATVRDAERASAQVLAPALEERLLREAVREEATPQRYRPDVNYDVNRFKQSRGLPRRR